MYAYVKPDILSWCSCVHCVYTLRASISTCGSMDVSYFVLCVGGGAHVCDEPWLTALGEHSRAKVTNEPVCQGHTKLHINLLEGTLPQPP